MSELRLKDEAGFGLLAEVLPTGGVHLVAFHESEDPGNPDASTSIELTRQQAKQLMDWLRALSL